MKKHLVLLTIFISCITNAAQKVDYSTKTPSDMLQTMTGANIRAFSVDDLFARPLDQDGLKAWNELINHVHNYVSLNNKQHLGKSKKLMNALATIEQANHEMIKTIKSAYSRINSKNELFKFSNKFASISNDMKQIQQDIKAMKFKNEKQKNAQTVLNNLAFYIEVNADAAFNHLKTHM